MHQDRNCGQSGCKAEAIGFIGKFGETRTTQPLVNTPPGIPISISYCEKHEQHLKLVLSLL
jgi:hypothetical protein